jgi:hypothetical protein
MFVDYMMVGKKVFGEMLGDVIVGNMLVDK